MKIVVKDEGRPFVFALQGSLDTNSSPQLEAYARELRDDGVNDIVVDMEGCPFVSSAGLRVIMVMQKQAASDGSLAFRNITSDVQEVFEMTGFDKILTIE